MKGKVYLVGAGPGDPELLTLKAARVLSKAEVVLYDRLVGEGVLALVNPEAHRIYVGKEVGQQGVQKEILALMLAHARKGRVVVRLKGGDPMVFGRGGEEWRFLAEEGIAVEVVPGVSSAIAAPSLAGIPLTLRGVAGGFAVVSGHASGGRLPSLAAYAGVETLVVLMGVTQRQQLAAQLIALGRPPDEPVAFIERSTTPRERVLEATLGQVAQGEVAVEDPAVWVMGEVVRWRRVLLAQGLAEPHCGR